MLKNIIEDTLYKGENINNRLLVKGYCIKIGILIA